MSQGDHATTAIFRLFFGPKRISYKYYLEPTGGKAQQVRREQQGGRVVKAAGQTQRNTNEQGTLTQGDSCNTMQPFLIEATF
ncbi:hypothetical protein [Candidatus Burkholderia verschuerenii]|uniref:hypothetical protein n=1 Tax=Candidatus Burkholderia verschuerenii TaxID=242163 RepID=UPI0018DD59D2|nr:hypothetical protein [Candidatus Burkholderia verschuerenii]